MSSITPHYRTVRQLLQPWSFSIDGYPRDLWTAMQAERRELVEKLVGRVWSPEQVREFAA